MAKARKLKGIDLGRFGIKDDKREERYIRVSFLIVSEGSKTEPNYLKKFNGIRGKVIYDVDCEGKGFNTLSLVNEAIRIRDKNPNKYERVWVVFDKDDFPDNSFNTAIQKAESNNIKCAWSNEAFELWYLLHFLYRNTAMNRSDYKQAIETEIRKTLPKFSYKKNSETMYEILESHGDEKQAIQFAEKLVKLYSDKNYANHNPRTQVFQLIKELRGLDKVLNEEIKKLINN